MPFELKLAFAGDIGCHHGEHSFVDVDSRYPVYSSSLLPPEARARHRLLYAGLRGWRRSRLGAATPNYSLKQHAPDQTGHRSQLPHCQVDLSIPGMLSYLCLIFMGFRGPKALNDSGGNETAEASGGESR